MIEKIISQHPFSVTNKESLGLESVLIDYKDNINKSETQTIKVFYKSETGKIRTSVSCTGCTKTSTKDLSGNVFEVEIKFTPNSRGIHRKAVRIYEYQNSKPSVVLILEAIIK